MDRGRTSETKGDFSFFFLSPLEMSFHLKIKCLFLLGGKSEQYREVAAQVSAWDVPSPGKLYPQPSLLASLNTVLRDAEFSHANLRPALAGVRQTVILTMLGC